MQGRKQLERHTTVDAPIGLVYRLFMDNAELAKWAPVVDAVTGEHGGDDTGVGATRTCGVTMNGRKGTMVEQCLEAVPDTRASFLVMDDSFGFNTMLTNYGFRGLPHRCPWDHQEPMGMEDVLLAVVGRRREVVGMVQLRVGLAAHS
jgi:hypothetical protein